MVSNQAHESPSGFVCLEKRKLQRRRQFVLPSTRKFIPLNRKPTKVFQHDVSLNACVCVYVMIFPSVTPVHTSACGAGNVAAAGKGSFVEAILCSCNRKDRIESVDMTSVI